MKVLAFLIAVTLSLTSCGQTKYPDHYKANNFEGVLFSKSDNFHVKQGKADPTRIEVYQAESQLKNKVDSLQTDFNKNSRVKIDILRKYKGYKREYFAYINSKGEKVILIWMHYSPEPFVKSEWTMTPRLYSDGWDSHWTISYNTKTHKLFNFNVNSLGG